MSENKSKEDATMEGCQEGGEEEGMAAERVEDKVSIQQILEGMTNEFNKSVSPVKSTEINRSEKLDHEEIEKSEINFDKSAIEKELAGDKDIEDISIKQKTTESMSIDENHREDHKEDTGKQEILKKDNGIPRIVLTFRTIDENTDDGKKTKISSCSSNLTLVPDELVNCDQIGGVSVKIENSDENSDNIEKSDSEEGRPEEVVIESKNKESEEKIEESKLPKEDMRVITEDKTTISNEKTKTDEADTSIEPTEQVDQADSTVPVTRKRRTGRPRLRALSDHTEESPGPKRSARRLCKETLKSTVLENAMARKEKSNYTEENLQFKKQRKYNKPGRPKKVIQGKDQNKQLQTKPPDIRQEIESSISDGNITISEVNSTLEYSRNSISENNANETILDESQSYSSDFDGMPKLSPMIKSSESQTKLNNSIGSSTSDDISLADIEKPFLKPAAGRPKRERGRPRGSQAARKIAKADSFEDGSVSIAETGKNNDYPEESIVPIKRTRRSMAPSPSPAEGQASKPESTAIMSETYSQSMLCLCQVRSQLYVTITGSGAPLYCTAIDSIDNRLVGCCNEVDSNDVAMRRPSTRVPFIILCRMHKERLLRHNCCPSCGLFCSQGRFIQCINGHQYHRECEIYPNKKGVCPHCGNETTAYDVMVTMSGLRKPVFIPTRKKFSKLPSAKMSLPGKGDNTKLAERPPSPLIQPDIIKIPEPSVNSERPERYTIMSLYTSVKNGDLEKLVNVLACGYNANHTFRDYAHRTGLHIAADKGHLSCVHVLVQAGAQLDVMDRNQLTPLMLAASKGKADVVKYLIRIGADVTLKGEDGMTALHMAAKSGHLEVCRIILTECKAPRTLVDSVDDGGWTSLIWACEFCHTDVARFLLDRKCDPLIRDAEQNIALHWSAFSGSSEITEMLLNEGCDVNAVNVHGDTPLHIAARQDQYAVSVLLLARGAKIGEVNAAGETAVNCCTNDGDTMSALRLNAKVNELSEHMWEKTIKILTNDISRGKETNPIQCVNGYDSEDKPTDFLYVTENCFTSNINVDRTITSLQSCRCEDNCSSEKCLCGNISLRCWYDEEGKLIPEFNYTDPPMLFECNPACDCNRITCNNRVIQHGLTQRFQLFRTKGKGWGLRTLRHIPKGSYVCEYVGEIISDSEADHREDDSYLFDLDNRDGETYCIDARRYGNIARFINHSCAPNLLPVRVFVEHQDLHFPRIAFFANRDIEADEELGFDYGEKFWIIKCKSFTCTCGAENCRYSEKTIQVTLDNYRRKIQQEEMLAAQSS
ncbi:histone-lysine N-methyltransferase EHMT2 isoform X2 [Apis mellifera]|uniref:Histone-lysine N-methyltransferase EHMT2 isoform X2 n=1 Tax=Apis mellifera TaxID=7460 RepID=A0A7M7TFG7_APIME|nr:histone-lysine N-methyltransferase EHMT2 isoform X2 [Apis mellifera]|eukprot:XP_396833.4 histone-lysine N-methyltransferase EHMT2 isoform X2 [Apis mellifera]